MGVGLRLSGSLAHALARAHQGHRPSAPGGSLQGSRALPACGMGGRGVTQTPTRPLVALPRPLFPTQAEPPGSQLASPDQMT